MSTLNLGAAKANGFGRTFATPLVNQNSYPAMPFSSLSFRIRTPLRPSLSNAAVKACFQQSNAEKYDGKGELMKFQANNRRPREGIPLDSILSPLRATCVTAVTAAAILFSQFNFIMKPAISAPVSPPSTVETSAKYAIGDEEREASLEEHLLSDPSDIEGLKYLMEIKIKSKKIPEAIVIIEKLIKLEPEDSEWPMLKAHLYAYSGDTELAKSGFSELLEKDPLSVEAYHGLVTVASQEDSAADLETVEKRVEEAVKLCKKENKKSDMRDFKLLLAQIRVIEGRYDTALKVYQELVNEEPKDFRPYLCQGIIYTLLKKNNEAEKSFEKYRRLVPKGHPYASYFDDNMIATKVFAQKMENERAMSKS